MKILLSAYACEPNKGSEPGVGWNWAVELARLGHEVWVLTRSNNRAGVDAALQTMPEWRSLHFIYYDLPHWASFWKKGGRGVYLYYFLWQWGASRVAMHVHAAEGFEVVHHVTFVGIRQPSFMGRLGIPFIYGPVAGGESAPWRLRRGYGPRGLLLDAVRDAMNLMVRFDPFVTQTFSRAQRIYVTSNQTKALIPVSFRGKARVQLAIGWHGGGVAPVSRPKNRPFRIVYVGRFLYWKGMHLGIAAFSKLVKQLPDARLTLVGKGPDEIRWRDLVAALGLQNNVEWVPWVAQSDLGELYSEHDIFLFPSLHDSGGMVVLEAMAHGLPVVCLELGGPGVMVDSSCGETIAISGKDEPQVIEELHRSLYSFASDDRLRQSRSRGALKRVDEFHWHKMVINIYSTINQGPASE